MVHLLKNILVDCPFIKMLAYHKIFSLVKPLKTIGFGDDLSNCSENLKSDVEAGQRPRMLKEELLPGENSQTEEMRLQHSLSKS